MAFLINAKADSGNPYGKMMDYYNKFDYGFGEVHHHFVQAECRWRSRKIYLQKSGGYLGSHKNQTSDKYTFSLKKIHDGYWELVVDKPLPKGEYAFSMMGMGSADTTASHTVYAFGID